jgi:hypothetical protein
MPGVGTLNATVIWQSEKAMADCHAERQATGSIGPICLGGVVTEVPQGTKAKLQGVGLGTSKVLVLEGPGAGAEGYIITENFTSK